MENASKALIIAGAILFALLTVVILIFAWRAAGNAVRADDIQKSAEQIALFNEQFTSYQKKALYGADVASVINKVTDNNIKYADSPEYKIEWQFTLTENLQFDDNSVLAKGTYNISKIDKYNSVAENPNKFKKFKRLYFECTSVRYSSSTGRVNKITFKQIDLFPGAT